MFANNRLQRGVRGAKNGEREAKKRGAESGERRKSRLSRSRDPAGAGETAPTRERRNGRDARSTGRESRRAPRYPTGRPSRFWQAERSPYNFPPTTTEYKARGRGSNAPGLLVAPPGSTMVLMVPSALPPLRMLVWPVLAEVIAAVAAINRARGELQDVGTGRAWVVSDCCRHCGPEIGHGDILPTVGLRDGRDMDVRCSIGRIKPGQVLVMVLLMPLPNGSAFGPLNAAG